MPQISFTQFRNELSRVLGTRQRAAAKASVKTVTATSMETESEGEGAVVKSHSKNIKKDGKINAQASQIKELRNQVGRGNSREFPNEGISKSNCFADSIYKCTAGCEKV